jgi:glutamate synthase domain-containing protein 3
MASLPLPDEAVLPVNEVRDYHLINLQVAQWLDAGVRRIRLTGVEGQRLLLAGLAGPWTAEIDVEGFAGPELATELNAAGVVVRGRGGAADAAGSHLWAGALVLFGPAGDGVGYRQGGGLIVVAGGAGHRAGLEQSGGTLVLVGPAGRLAAERQRGGSVLALRGAGPHLGRGATGGTRWAGTEDEARREVEPLWREAMAAHGDLLREALAAG